MKARELTPSEKLALTEKYGMVGERPVDNFGSYKGHWPDGPNPAHLADEWCHGVSLDRDDFMPCWRKKMMGRKPGQNETQLIRCLSPQPVRHRGVEVPAIIPTESEAEAMRAKAQEMDQRGDVKDWLEVDQDLDAIGFILDTDCELSPEFQLAAYLEAFSATGPRVVWWHPADVALRTGFPGVCHELAGGPLKAVENEFTSERHYSWRTPVPVRMDPSRWARLQVEDGIARAAQRGESICCDRCWSGWDRLPDSDEVCEDDDLTTTVYEWRDRQTDSLKPGCAVFLIRSGNVYVAAAMCDRCGTWTREDAATHPGTVIDCPPL